MGKIKSGRQLLVVIMGIAIWLTGVSSPKAVLKAWAAELPNVTGLEVAAAEDGMGVIARCSYQNYTDQSGCEMKLYLYRIEDAGEIIEAEKILPYADQRNASTDSIQVPEGLYKASVSIDDGVDIKQINSQNYYRVKQNSGNYEVIENSESESVVQANDYLDWEINLSCSHECEYVLEQEATPMRDAIQAYQCIRCGVVLEYIEVPNSAYAEFLKESVSLIQNAQPGEVFISTDRWISFNRNVLETIRSRPDVTVMVRYRYLGEEHLLLIPAGTNISSLVNESEFCGFRRIEEFVSLMTSL